jgi:hypothetical protein
VRGPAQGEDDDEQGEERDQQQLPEALARVLGVRLARLLQYRVVSAEQDCELDGVEDREEHGEHDQGQRPLDAAASAARGYLDAVPLNGRGGRVRRRERADHADHEQDDVPRSAGDRRVRHETGEEIREGGVRPGEQRAEDQQQDRGHHDRAQHRAHVAPGAAGPLAQPAPAPGGAGEQRGVETDRAEQHPGPGAAAVQGERARRHGGHEGEEGRPVGVAERRYGQQGESSDAPHQRPAAHAPARRLGREVRAERGRYRHQEEIEGQAVTQQKHAEHAGGQGGPEGGGTDGRRGLRLAAGEPGLDDRAVPVFVRDADWPSFLVRAVAGAGHGNGVLGLFGIDAGLLGQRPSRLGLGRRVGHGTPSRPVRAARSSWLRRKPGTGVSSCTPVMINERRGGKINRGTVGTAGHSASVAGL